MEGHTRGIDDHYQLVQSLQKQKEGHTRDKQNKIKKK
jgi:hypothetical protein